MFRYVFPVCLWMLFVFTGSAQTNPMVSLDNSLLSGSGGTLMSQTTSLEWSIGEPVIQTLNSNSVWLTQGFHQGTMNRSFVSASRESGAAVNIWVQPNPTASILMVGGTNTLSTSLECQVSSLQGYLLLSVQFTEENQQRILDLSHLARGMYVLTVRSEESNMTSAFLVSKID